ncbi:MAG: YiiD C-terminal domain-containing protein [Chitinophagaceae bacterium]
MNILNLPFTKKIGIEKTLNKEFLLELPFLENNENHIRTLHGSAIFSFAEITSGYFLRQNFEDIASQTVPILRNADIKFKKPVSEKVYSKAKFINTNRKLIMDELSHKNKILFDIEVKIYSEAKILVATGIYEWFVRLNLN